MIVVCDMLISAAIKKPCGTDSLQVSSDKRLMGLPVLCLSRLLLTRDCQGTGNGQNHESLIFCQTIKHDKHNLNGLRLSCFVCGLPRVKPLYMRLCAAQQRHDDKAKRSRGVVSQLGSGVRGQSSRRSTGRKRGEEWKPQSAPFNS